MNDLTARTVRSADGTAIEYLTTGHGPGLLMIPGALATARSLGALAVRLGERHTVHVLQRRGRGGSGPQGDRYAIERECEDVEAVRAQTGARLLFGHSYGGLVALQAARGTRDLDAVVAYEPGVSDAGSLPVGWVDQARAEDAAGASMDAFLTFVRGINPDTSGRLPRWLLRLVLRAAMPRAELRETLVLMPEAIREHVEVGRLDSRLADYASITAAVLVVRGTGRATDRQPAALARLVAAIPGARGVALPGLDHFAPEKKPDAVAAVVGPFLDGHAARGTLAAPGTAPNPQ